VKAPHVPGAIVVSTSTAVRTNFTVPAFQPTLKVDVTGLNFCEVNVTLNHHGADDRVLVQTWLPLEGWNERFIAIGGGAWAAGLGAPDLAFPASQGYAVSSTNAGLTGTPYSPAPWALKPNGKVNRDLLENFASRSIHDMAIVGQKVTASFYGRSARARFWSGCSTGGRQGLEAAQKYPKDFDGILAGAPAIYWTEYVIAELWPLVVMKEAGFYPSNCELAGVVQQAIAACDEKDKVKDGVIADPFHCKYDPMRAVGVTVECETGGQVTITKETASIVSKIWKGPVGQDGKKIWDGVPIGASLAGLAGTTTEVNGTSGTALPFSVAADWAKYFVKADPKFDTTALDTKAFTKLFQESKHKLSSIIESADPNLSRFAKAGGKLLVWHGLADQIIFPQDSVNYLHEVEKTVGPLHTSDFFRLFLAPGVDHCGYGPTPGAVPSSPLDALVSWVEDGIAPESLEAETLPQSPHSFTRKICRYPLVAKHSPCSDPSVASSYTCVEAEKL
jgi:hypothetical protein